jgi:hypothetical protein
MMASTAHRTALDVRCDAGALGSAGRTSVALSTEQATAYELAIKSAHVTSFLPAR